MTATPPPPERDPAAARRARLIGRILIIGFALLVAAYLVPLFLSLAH